jgi:hypothetical protein
MTRHPTRPPAPASNGPGRATGIAEPRVPARGQAVRCARRPRALCRRRLAAVAVLAAVLSLLAADAAGAQRYEDWPGERLKPPRNVVPPRIAGEPVAGTTLIGDDGRWSGVQFDLARRWQRLESGLWLDIARAVGPSHVLRDDDVGHRLRLFVRGWGFGGTAAAHSAPTELVSAAPRPVKPPKPAPTPAPPPAPAGPAPPPPARAVPAPAPAPTVEPLIAGPTAAFRSTGRATITLRWRQRAAISGALRRRDGRPVGGARLAVSSRLHVPDATAVPLGEVTTTTAGTFNYTPRVGPSRTVTFAFPDATGVRSAAVTILVVPKVTLRARRGGRLDGRVTGAPPGIRKLVELQAAAGRTWRTIAVTRLEATGGRFSHRLRTLPRRVRAAVRAEPGWPFLTGISPPATIRR